MDRSSGRGIVAAAVFVVAAILAGNFLVEEADGADRASDLPRSVATPEPTVAGSSRPDFPVDPRTSVGSTSPADDVATTPPSTEKGNVESTGTKVESTQAEVRPQENICEGKLVWARGAFFKVDEESDAQNHWNNVKDADGEFVAAAALAGLSLADADLVGPDACLLFKDRWVIVLGGWAPSDLFNAATAKDRLVVLCALYQMHLEKDCEVRGGDPEDQKDADRISPSSCFSNGSEFRDQTVFLGKQLDGPELTSEVDIALCVIVANERQGPNVHQFFSTDLGRETCADQGECMISCSLSSRTFLAELCESSAEGTSG